MKKKVLIVLIIILFGGGAAGWYFFLREPASEEVLAKMQQAMLAVHSAHSESAFTVDVDLSDLPLEDTPETFTPFLPKESKITVNLLLVSDNAVDALGLPLANQSIIELYTSPTPLVRLAAEVRNIDKLTYFKLNDIGLFLPFDFSEVKGQWYRADDLQKLADLEEKREAITGEERENQWDERIKEIRQASAQADLFGVVQRLPNESISGVATRHYRVKLDIPGTRAYLEKLFEIFKIEQTDEGRAFLDRAMMEAESASGELWIGKRDFRLYRLTLQWPFRYVAPEEKGSVAFKLALTVTNSKFNDPVEVPAPEDARDQQEFMKKLLGGFLGGLTGGLPASGDRGGGDSLLFGLETQTLPGAEADPGAETIGDTDSDSDGLTDVQEGFWGSNPQNPDTDGDGYQDGAEVNSGYSPNGPGRLF